MRWTPDRLPDLTGKTYAITGGNGGLGLEAAKILTAKGARVVITARSEAKAEGALAEIREATPDADVAWVQLDLADADSVAAAADALLQACPRLDAIINNAGVMQPPLRRTAEGFELQMATNHIGHFRLNARLLGRLEESGGRIVPVSSIGHRMGTINFDDLRAHIKIPQMRMLLIINGDLCPIGTEFYPVSFRGADSLTSRNVPQVDRILIVSSKCPPFGSKHCRASCKRTDALSSGHIPHVHVTLVVGGNQLAVRTERLPFLFQVKHLLTGGCIP